MEKFLSCDWGSSNFRLRLVQLPDLSILAEESSQEGISSSFTLWKQSLQKEEDRLFFYLRMIKDHIQLIEGRLGTSLKGIPLVVSGMASSNLGMVELPYKEIPFLLDGSELEWKRFEPSGFFNHELLLISGARSDQDVMRGEETLLIGAASGTGEELFIFPGTHSKHVRVNEGRVLEFKTFMTGEFFHCLSTAGMLAAAVEKTPWSDQGDKAKAFRKGIRDSGKSHLLNTAFWVRTNQLFAKLSKPENYYYLSGLLIGAELRAFFQSASCPITLVQDAGLGPLYELAIGMLGNAQSKMQFRKIDVARALVSGQWKILNRMQ